MRYRHPLSRSRQDAAGVRLRASLFVAGDPLCRTGATAFSRFASASSASTRSRSSPGVGLGSFWFTTTACSVGGSGSSGNGVATTGAAEALSQRSKNRYGASMPSMTLSRLPRICRRSASDRDSVVQAGVHAGAYGGIDVVSRGRLRLCQPPAPETGTQAPASGAGSWAGSVASSWGSWSASATEPKCPKWDTSG